MRSLPRPADAAKVGRWIGPQAPGSEQFGTVFTRMRDSTNQRGIRPFLEEANAPEPGDNSRHLADAAEGYEDVHVG
jgi:hypothetical protein